MPDDRSRIRRKDADRGSRIAGPRAASDPDLLPPKFCLRQMRKGYSLEDCVKDERAAFALRLYELSRSKWSELRQMPRHGQGYEKIERRALREAIPPEVTPDVDLIAFRFSGKAPMVGYRSKDGVFNIIWLDRAFTLYDHG